MWVIFLVRLFSVSRGTLNLCLCHPDPASLWFYFTQASIPGQADPKQSKKQKLQPESPGEIFFEFF